MFGKFSYIGYTLLFGGVPILICWIFYHRLFLRRLKLLIKPTLTIFIGVVIVENVALKNNLWFFPIEKRLGVDPLGIHLDDYVFALITGLGIFFLILILLELERKQASLFTWLKTIVGISSLAIMTTVIMLFLRLTI